MRKTLSIALLALSIGVVAVGCKQESFDENYTKEIKMTPEQKAKVDAEAAKHPAPGAVKPGEPVPKLDAPGGQLPLPKGKGH